MPVMTVVPEVGVAPDEDALFQAAGMTGVGIVGGIMDGGAGAAVHGVTADVEAV